jgi:cytoskeletal protein CcmA (bactofilin family)
MWKLNETPRPNGSAPAVTPAPAAPASVMASGVESERQPERKESETVRDEQVTIGKSIVIKGELTGAEDLTIEGEVEGKVELRDNVVTIGPSGRIRAQVFAKSIVVLGQVAGNLTAIERVTIREHGSVEGDIVAPGVAIAEGAYFRGTIDMQRKDQVASKSVASVAHRAEGKAPAPAVSSPVVELAGV